MDALTVFSPITAQWFSSQVGVPTPVQEAAWPPIARGEHTLVSAPTGTGKTLSAFLVFVDRLLSEAFAGTLRQELQLIYVSPLKSLAGDIRENLRRPLDGICDLAKQQGSFSGQMPVDIALRTGDTPQSERRGMLRHPPHILITTPESLFLMLTAKSSQAVLRTAKYIIIDELHALMDTKRGAHLLLSIARLDRLCKAPLKRIGLSATVAPLQKAADYLSPDPVAIAAPHMRKEISLTVTSPTAKSQEIKKNAAWQEIAKAVYALCESSRSVIAFVEGRAYAERLAFYVNQLGGEGFARTHHGSLSMEQRLSAEKDLREGKLRLLCATSSMELGIDVGQIDQVMQVGCPRTVSSAMQRLGRAGHNPNRVSVMHIFPRSPEEALYSALTAQTVRLGGVELARPPRLCLDVLAQHLVSMAAFEGYGLQDVMDILPRAYPFREITLADVREVLCMLSGDEEHDRDIPVRPRVLYDRIHDRVDPDPYSRMLAVSAGGTIPDRGLFAARTESGVKLGDLDEEFVFEARVGDRFLLGSFAWQIRDIKKDTVVVAPAATAGAQPPFWKGDMKGRRLETGLAFGRILRGLQLSNEAGPLLPALMDLGLDHATAQSVDEYLKRQTAATGALPDDKTLLAEHYRDETGIHQIMVHSVFGRMVNEPLAILCAAAARRALNMNVSFVADDDGFLLFPYEDCAMPEGLLYAVAPESAGAVLRAALPGTPLYNMAFRYNAARALMMGMKSAGRQPLWVQRMRGAQLMDALVKKEDHPLVRETKRECLEDYWDVDGVQQIIAGIRAGTIRVAEMHTDTPSPMSLTLRRQTEAAMMYDYAPTTPAVHLAVSEALERAEAISPHASQLETASHKARRPENPAQLHAQLLMEGDRTADELDAPFEWLEELESAGQALYIEPGLWIAAEHAQAYEAALQTSDAVALTRIVRRLLRYGGAQSANQVNQRYGLAAGAAEAILSSLAANGEAVLFEGLYYHGQLFDRAVRETVKMRRLEIKTLPARRYAALLAARAEVNAPAAEQLDAALSALSGQAFPPAFFESLLLPLRVKGYRPEMLDALLAKGKMFWRMAEGPAVSFHPFEDTDWEADLAACGEGLSGNEKKVFDLLKSRGASFLAGLSPALPDGSAYDTLLNLLEKGTVRADSFVPVRQWIAKGQTEAASPRQRARTRVMAATCGRWELARPLRELPLEQQLERAFDQRLLLCRETAPEDVIWADALRLLRMWEYTGRVRRGYFVEGLSGMQYIRDKDFIGVTQALAQEESGLSWLPSPDPSQAWGRYLPHIPDRSFLLVPGTLVALRDGAPAAVMERQGKTLRVFAPEVLAEAMQAFAKGYAARRLYPALNRITVKEYPAGVEDAFLNAGFKREMRDFVLYRSYQ